MGIKSKTHFHIPYNLGERKCAKFICCFLRCSRKQLIIALFRYIILKYLSARNNHFQLKALTNIRFRNILLKRKVKSE